MHVRDSGGIGWLSSRRIDERRPRPRDSFARARHLRRLRSRGHAARRSMGAFGLLSPPSPTLALAFGSRSRDLSVAYGRARNLLRILFSIARHHLQSSAAGGSRQDISTERVIRMLPCPSRCSTRRRLSPRRRSSAERGAQVRERGRRAGRSTSARDADDVAFVEAALRMRS